MKSLLQIFSPNKVISKSAMMWVVVFQVLTLGFIWLFESSVFVPTPVEVFKASQDLWNEGIATELAISFKLNLQAIGIATVVSLLFSYVAVIPFFRPMVVVLGKFRFLSMAGLSFFFTLMAHSGHELKLYLLVFSVSVFFITSMADVIASIPKVQFDLARTLQMGDWGIVFEVIVLGQTDKVFDVLRQNAAISFMMLTMVEGMSREEGGIGAVLLNNNKHFHMPAVFAIQGMILFIGLGQDYTLGFIKRLFCPYARLTTEAK